MDTTPYDDLLGRLVEIAKSELREALNILFINHRLIPSLTVLPGKELLGLIKVDGPADDALSYISLAKSKLSISVPSILGDAKTVISMLRQLEAEFTKYSPQAISPELINRLISSKLPGHIPLLAKNLLEGCIACLLEYYLTVLRPKQDGSVKNSSTTIDYLSRQGLMEPWLQTSVCTNCGSFELLTGSHPTRETTCAKCNARSVCVRVYLFDERFSELKMKDNDLPYFISRYLNTMSFSRRADAFTWLTPDTEVDVYVRDQNVGIECKTFVRELTYYEEDVKSKTGELIQQLKRYYSAGIKKVFLVSSLPKLDTERLENSLREKAKQENMTLEIRMVPGDIDELIYVLDNEILGKR